MIEIDLFGNTKQDIINDYFLYWKKKGYPNYKAENYNKKKELDALIFFNENTIFQNKILKQTMHSCGFLWTYFPHWIDVKYNNQKTIRELWEDDKKLKELIEKTYEYEKKFGNGFISENRLRQNSKVYLSKQSVSNFRPTVSKFIYNNFGNNGVVWDMSCGWGGRLFGFLSSNCKTYIGTEPCVKTFEGLIKLKNDFNRKEVFLYNKGSEEYNPKENSLDLCFTSPPYFDTEKYSEEKTQSYIKFNTKNTWLSNFYEKTIYNCYIGLKKGGYMIINISNTPKHKWLEEETIKISNKIGFILTDIYKLELSSISGKGKKYEPIFIFQK